MTIESYDYVLITMKYLIDLQILDKHTLSLLTADVIDDKRKVVCPNATMNIWLQNSLMILSDMIKGFADSLGGTRHSMESTISKIKMDDWNEYKEGWKKKQTTVIPSLKPTSANTGSNSNTQSNASNFSRNNLKDRSQYKVLKDERQYNNWQILFSAVAITHELDELFDDSCVPGVSPDEQALWNKKQQFVSSVFDLTLKTDYGKNLVQKYQDTFDSQTIWQGLVKYMKTSSKSNLTASDLLAWLTSSKYDQSWPSTRSYILYWQNKLQEYHTYCSKEADPFSDIQK